MTYIPMCVYILLGDRQLSSCRSDQVATLEPTAQARAMPEGPSFDAVPLLDAFDRFVAGVAARQRPHACSEPALAGPAPHDQRLTR
jgi:hypothetical protein